jgi:hypothetical protein
MAAASTSTGGGSGSVASAGAGGIGRTGGGVNARACVLCHQHEVDASDSNKIPRISRGLRITRSGPGRGIAIEMRFPGPFQLRN